MLIQNIYQTFLDFSTWFLLGLVFSAALHEFIPRRFVEKHLGSGGRFSVLKAVIFGVPMPLCSCAVIPAGIGLKKSGASSGAAMGFLISTPQTGVDSIFVSASFLGWPFALFKVFAAFVTGLIGGTLENAFGRGDDCSASNAAEKAANKKPSLQSAYQFAVDELLYTLWKWLLFGIIVSAIIDTWMGGQDVFNNTFTTGIQGKLLILVTSLCLYVCATASVPIAASLVSAGLSPGAALVFLMAGPATNVATMGAIKKEFGLKSLLIYLGILAVSSIGFGEAFDHFLSASALEHSHEHSNSILDHGSAIFLIGFIAMFMVQDIRKWLDKGKKGGLAQSSLTVTGMTCKGCARKIENALTDNGFSQIQVDLEAKKVSFSAPENTGNKAEGIIQVLGFGVEAPTSCCGCK